MDRIRGPKPGTTAGHKRKASTELSENAHTKRGRERLARMSEVEKKIERAKAADTQAVSREHLRIKKSAKYQEVSEEEKALMLSESKMRLLKLRYVKKRSAKHVMELHGYGIDTIEDVDNDLFDPENRRRNDDMLSSRENTMLTDDTNLENAKVEEDKYRKAAAHFKSRMVRNIWRHWRRFWLRYLRSLKKKLLELKRGSVPMTEPPHIFFCAEEVEIWKARTFRDMKSEKYTLPGPAE